MIGARDMAFPRLNALSFWLLLFGGIVFYMLDLLRAARRPAGRSTRRCRTTHFTRRHGVDAWIFLIHLTGLSSILGAINFIATIHNMRAQGHGLGRMPLFVWTILIYSYLLILALPSIAAAVTMLLTDRHFGTALLRPARGGDPLLWQHLFWFFGHPEVYIMVLPAFGMISEIMPVFARKPIFGYKAIAASTAAIAFLGMLVWAHHMFATPTPTVVLAFFMLSLVRDRGAHRHQDLQLDRDAVARARSCSRCRCYFAVGFIAQFVIGGISGVMPRRSSRWTGSFTDTYFIVAHIHYVLFGGSVFGIFAGLYYWFPKMSGRMMSETLGKASFWLMFIGFNTHLPGRSTRSACSACRGASTTTSRRTSWGVYNLISTIGSFILALGVLITVFNVVRSVKVGKKAGNDPWRPTRSSGSRPRRRLRTTSTWCRASAASSR